MARDELSLFSYEVLGLVGTGGAGPHDLKRMVRQGRLMAWAGESQYYSEPKRLAKLGYLESRREPGRTGERTVYSLTEKGIEALRAWSRTPARFTPLKSEPLDRMLVADIVGEEATRESIVALRDDLDDLTGRIRDMERAAAALPHRRKYLELAIDLMRETLRIHREWVDEVERKLS
jgi:DNA-binding PadR family transcriptional regulator